MSNRIARQIALTTTVVVATGGAALTFPSGSAAAEEPGIDCAEWDHADFDAEVERLDAATVRLTMTYADTDPLGVCPFTVFHSLRDGDGNVVTAGSDSAVDVAAATASVTGEFVVDMAHTGCDWEVWIGIEESLPIVLESTDVCWSDLVIDDWFVAVPVEPISPIGPLRPTLPAPTVGFAGPWAIGLR